MNTRTDSGCSFRIP